MSDFDGISKRYNTLVRDKKYLYLVSLVNSEQNDVVPNVTSIWVHLSFCYYNSQVIYYFWIF